MIMPKLKSKQSQYIALSLSGIMIGLVLTGIILNVSVIIRLNGLKKDIQKDKENMTVKIEEEVSKTLNDPLLSEGGSSTESGVLVNTKDLLTSEQVQAIKNDVTQSCKAYLTDDVYLGLKELVVSDLQSQIDTIIKEKTDSSFTKEQQTVVSTAVQETVMKEVNQSLSDIKDQVSSSNKAVKVLESNFTILNGRMDKLESSVNSSINALQEKDNKIEGEITELRLSFVSSNTGTSSLNILKVQMATIDTILTESANTINDALSSDPETKKTYLAKIAGYRNTVTTLKAKVEEAISNGDKDATENVTQEAANIATEIVNFASMIETSKTSINDLQTMIKDNTMAIADKQKQITLLKKQQSDLETSQKTLNDAQKALNDALSGKISTEDALKRINDSIGSLDGFGSVAEKISAIMNTLQNADDANKQAALQDAADKVATLKTSIEEKMTRDKKALEDTQATLASKTELSEVSNDITSIIGDIGQDTTISKELANVSKNLEDKAKEITDNTNNALTALQSETEADLSSLTSGQTSLQSYIDSLGTGTENDVLKDKLQAIEDARVKAVEDAKKEASIRVNELNSNLTTEIEKINTTITDTNKIIQSVQEGKLDASALAGEINNMLTSDGSIGTAIATELGKARSILQESIGKTAEDADKALNDAKSILDAEDVRVTGLIKENKDSITNLSTDKADKKEVDSAINQTMTYAEDKANLAVTSAVEQAATDATKKSDDAQNNAVTDAKSYTDEKTEGMIKAEYEDGTVKFTLQ